MKIPKIISFERKHVEDFKPIKIGDMKIQIAPNIHIISGDVTEVDCNIIAHQVNCRGVMGSGVALAIRNKYPYIYEQYKKCCDQCDEDYLIGRSLIVLTTKVPNFENPKLVCNLFGQKDYGRNKKHTDEIALRNALCELNNYCKDYIDYCNDLLNTSSNIITVALPYGMGSVRGGAEWNDVLEIIKETLIDCDVLICKLYE